MAETEAYTQLGGNHPVVVVVVFRVEAVVKAVGCNFERNTYRLCHIGLQTQSGAYVVAQLCPVPYERHVKFWVWFSQFECLVVAPCSVESDTSDEHYVYGVILLAEQLVQVEQQVEVGGYVVPFVICACIGKFKATF